MDVRIIDQPITRAELNQIAKERFGDLVKAVVDTDRRIMAIGGDLHADEEAVLLEQGSEQRNLWGINLYPDLTESDWIEFDSVINFRPSLNNRSRDIEDKSIRQAIIEIVKILVV